MWVLFFTYSTVSNIWPQGKLTSSLIIVTECHVGGTTEENLDLCSTHTKWLQLDIFCVCAFRDMLITDLPATLTFEELCEEVRIMCSVAKQLPITLKWLDDEGGCASMWNTAVRVPCLWPFYMLAKLWLISWSFGLSKSHIYHIILHTGMT